MSAAAGASSSVRTTRGVPTTGPSSAAGAPRPWADVTTLKQLRAFKPPDPAQQPPSFLLPDGGKYYGDCHHESGVPHGRGVAFFGDGSKYCGDWAHGHQHGAGAIIAPSYEFEGQVENDCMHGSGYVLYKESFAGFVSRGMGLGDAAVRPLEYRGDLHREFHRHGKGAMKYRNDDVYDGEWSHNCRHGTGVLTRDDGERYVGEFQNDVRCGQGTVSYPDGCIFTGVMANNKRVGTGCLVFPNGDEYCGAFSDDSITGHGTMRYKNGDIYDGEWLDGVRHGRGKFSLHKNGAAVSGSFIKGLIHGRGTVELRGKSLFVGDFERGERRSGTLWLQDGGCYWGQWRGDAMHGTGIMWYANGDTYYGSWLNSLRHGPGCCNHADGSEYSGEFQGNERCGVGLLVSPDGTRIQSGIWKANELAAGYEGEWDGQCFSGRGALRFLDGTVYDGLWVSGVRAFCGLVEFADKLRYFGAWRADSPSGMGILAYPTGEVYQGELHNGRREGTGVCACPTTGRMFSGHFAANLQTGAGALFEVDLTAPILEPITPAPAAGADPSGVSSPSASDPGSASTPTSTAALLLPSHSRRPRSASDANGATAGSKPAATAAPAVATPGPTSGGGNTGGRGFFSFLFGSKKASRVEEPQFKTVGYEPLYVCEGTWKRHRQFGRGRVFLPDGRVFQGTWLAGKLKVDMPHRGSIIAVPDMHQQHPQQQLQLQTTSPLQCLFCGNTFGIFRKQAACLLCGRALCTSCLKETSNLSSVGVAVDRTALPPAVAAMTVLADDAPVSEGATSSATTAVQQHRREQEEPASSLSSSFATTQLLLQQHKEVDAAAVATATGAPIKACADCANSIQLKTHHGTLWDSTGVVAYRGFLAGDVPHGEGSLWNGDSSFYHGAFHLGKRHGIGKLTHQTGETYYGSWDADAMHGRGCYRCASGVVFEGMWERGKLQKLEYIGEMAGDDGIRQGHGVAFLNDGSRFNGQWLRGVYHGLGMLHHSATAMTASGQFRAGRMNGLVKVVRSSSVFVGHMVDDERDGRGTERCGDVTTTGEWRAGKLTGTVSIFRHVDSSETLCAFFQGEERGDVFIPEPQVPDDAVLVCHSCGTSFSLFTRKHHCRLCGRIFDSACSKKRAVLPEHFGFGIEPQRLCNSCHTRIVAGQGVRIVFFADGGATACFTSRGEWCGDGLRRGADGVITISTADVGFTSQLPASREEVQQFRRRWQTHLVACGIDEMDLERVLRPAAEGMAQQRPRTAPVTFEETELHDHLFDVDRVNEPGFAVANSGTAMIPTPPLRPVCSDSAFLATREADDSATKAKYNPVARVPTFPSRGTIERQLATIREVNSPVFAIKQRALQEPVTARPSSPGTEKEGEEDKPSTAADAVAVDPDDAAAGATASVGTQSASDGHAPPLPPSLLHDDDSASDAAVVSKARKGTDAGKRACGVQQTRQGAATPVAPTSPSTESLAAAAAVASANFRGHINKPVPPRPPERQHEQLSWDFWKTRPAPFYDPKVAAAVVAHSEELAREEQRRQDAIHQSEATSNTVNENSAGPGVLNDGAAATSGGASGSVVEPGTSSALPRASPFASALRLFGAGAAFVAAPASVQAATAVPSTAPKPALLASAEEAAQLLAAAPDFKTIRDIPPISEPSSFTISSAPLVLPTLEEPLEITVAVQRSGPVVVTQRAAARYKTAAIPFERGPESASAAAAAAAQPSPRQPSQLHEVGASAPTASDLDSTPSNSAASRVAAGDATGAIADQWPSVVSL